MTEALEIKSPAQITIEGKLSLKELKNLVTRRPDKDKLIINGKQYLYFTDWQMLGIFNGITARVVETKTLTQNVPIGEDGKFFKIETVGFEAKADAIRNGQVLSSAVAICMREEKNWEKKELFAMLSMAETRAMAKALRNCLQWIVKLPDSNFTDEEVEQSGERSL